METRIRQNVDGEYYAETGDECSTFHSCPTRPTLQDAEKDGLEAYGVGEDEWREPGGDYARDVVLVAGTAYKVTLPRRGV